MRGAGCTYNDIVDQDLDAQVERTALRPLPAGTVSTKQAWIWLFAQCAVGLVVLLCLPRLAQIISLCSIPLVAAYPFMKRITWWPQLWLGMTFNWAVLVAYAAKTGSVSLPLFILYAGLIFWTVGYDTIYACQDIEDDMKIGVKSTARRFGKRIKIWVTAFYGLFVLFALNSLWMAKGRHWFATRVAENSEWHYPLWPIPINIFIGFTIYTLSLAVRFNPNDKPSCLRLFKSNWLAAGLLILTLLAFSHSIWSVVVTNIDITIRP